MSQKGNFISVPYSIEKDGRLTPWMNYPRVNPLAVCYAIVRMMGRLGRARDREIAVSELLAGIHNKNLPYLVLKDVITQSGFFEYSQGFVTYNWERFANRLYGREPQEENVRRKRKSTYNFIMVPNDLELDPRLHPWLTRSHVSTEALCYTVVCMMGRLARERETPLTLKQLTAGLNSKNIPYSLLEDLVKNADFFDYTDGMVHYNWEKFCTRPDTSPDPGQGSRKGPETKTEKVRPKFAQDGKIGADEASNMLPNCPEDAPTTCAHMYLNYQQEKIKQKEEDRKTESFSRDTHTQARDNERITSDLYARLAPKELAAKLGLRAKVPEDAKERIHKMVEETYYEDDSLSGWWSPTLEGRKRLLEKKLYSLFRLRKSKLAEIVGRNLGIQHYRELWPDIVMAYIEELWVSPGFYRMDTPNKVNLYFFILSKACDKKAHTYQSGLQMLRDVKSAQENRRLTAYQPRQALRRWSGWGQPPEESSDSPASGEAP